jgi:predicted metal-binding membrane protein
MMLATSLPLLALFHALTRRRRDWPLLAALVIAGFLAVWTTFGLVVHAADLRLHAAIAANQVLAPWTWLIGSATFLVAGVYQFTSLKFACLDRCRAPLGFILAHWRGQRERLAALRIGLHHGFFCVGCCWSLMLLMFAVGVGSLGWMLGLGAVMAAEKNLPWGRRLTAPLGLLFLTAGTALVLRHVIA